jgi:cytochrome c553
MIKIELLSKYLIVAVFSAYAALAHAADPNTGKTKSSSCSVCHGLNGVAVTPEAPNLAGQPSIYLAQQLKNYKSGKRSHEIMSLIAKQLGEQDIDDIAAWYSSIQINVSGPN